MKDKNVINNSESAVEKVMNKAVFSTLMKWSLFTLAISLILFVLMCIKAELYSYLWKDEFYKGLGILAPLFVALPLVGTVLLGIGNIKRVKNSVVVIQFLAGVFALVGYICVLENTGGHVTTPEFYGRRFLAIWFMVDFIGAFFMRRAVK